MIIDAHSDIPQYILKYGKEAFRTRFEEDMVEHGVKAIINAIFLEGEELTHPKESALMQLKAAKDYWEDSPITPFFSLEGAEPIESLDDVAFFKKEGIGLVGLTWSRVNRFASGCDFDFPTNNPGLTKEGFELLKALEEHDIIIDVSHLSDLGVKDVLKETKGRIIASHSNLRSFTNVPRNLTDEDAKAIADRGGVIGLNVASSFVSAKEKPSVGDLGMMLLHMIDVVGEDHVGFGLDMCDTLFEEGFDGPRKNYDVLTNYKDVKAFSEALEEFIPERVIQKVTHKNWERILYK
ncbi:dipeptidase [Guggenheimella bovis]